LILNAIVFFNSVQQAFVVYPLCVRGARANRVQFSRIVGFALLATFFLVATVFGPALSVVGASLHRSTLIAAAVCAMVCWQLQDTLRMGFIAKLEQRRALFGDAVSYAGQALLIGTLSLWIRPGLNFILWTIAGTSAVAFVAQSWQIKPLWPPNRVARPLRRQFWTLGRWNVVAKLIGFLTLQAFPWLILIRHGRVEVAAFQAIFQFLAFTNPLTFSVGSLITATVAKHGDYRTPSVRNYSLIVVLAVGSYLLALGVAGRFVMGMLYGSTSVYLSYAPLLRIFAPAWSLDVVALLASCILGGLREARSMFIVQLSGAVAAVLIVLPWIYWTGLTAAAFGMLFVSAVKAGTGVLLLARSRSAARPANEAQ
jgi:hypothetical protein